MANEQHRPPLIATCLRRAITLPVFLGGWLLAWVITPLVLPALAIVDVARRSRLALARAWLMALVYLTAEAVGIVWSFCIWLTRGSSQVRYDARNFRLECWWGGVQFAIGRRIFDIRLEIEGEEVLDETPYILFIRHVSVIDNLIPVVFASERRGTRLRWVLNRSLLRDPCIDIIGYRLPNCFVRGGTNDSASEIQRMRVLAEGMGGNEGLVVYPEGTLFSRKKRERVLVKLRESGGDPELVERAAAMQNVLPPRFGGTLAVLDARPGTDVVFCSHSGLDMATTRAQIADGALIGTTLRVVFWRVAAADIPSGDDARKTWMLDQWAKVDAFVAEAAAPEDGSG